MSALWWLSTIGATTSALRFVLGILIIVVAVVSGIAAVALAAICRRWFRLTFALDALGLFSRATFAFCLALLGLLLRLLLPRFHLLALLFLLLPLLCLLLLLVGPALLGGACGALALYLLHFLLTLLIDTLLFHARIGVLLVDGALTFTPCAFGRGALLFFA